MSTPPLATRCDLCGKETDDPISITYREQMSGPGWVGYADQRCVKVARIIPLAEQAFDERYGSLQVRPAP